MDVIMHLGAHRTATSSFQDYLRRHAKEFADEKVAVHTPQDRRRRSDRNTGPQRRECSAITGDTTPLQCQMDQALSDGQKTLLVSNTDLIGTVADNLTHRSLYPDIAERVAHSLGAFKAEITTVLFTMRSLDLYWCSALMHGVASGQSVPSRDVLQQIAHGTRSWRDVITDLSTTLPGAEIRILPFDKFAGRSDAMLAAGAGISAPVDTERGWLNRAPALPELRRILNDRGVSPTALPFGMGRWNPFTNEEHAALREMHADDMMWLTAGANGLATLVEDVHEGRAGQTPPLVVQEKGQCDELEKRQLARPG